MRRNSIGGGKGARHLGGKSRSLGKDLPYWGKRYH